MDSQCWGLRDEADLLPGFKEFPREQGHAQVDGIGAEDGAKCWGWEAFWEVDSGSAFLRR